MTKRDKPGQSSALEVAARLREATLFMKPIRAAARSKLGSYGAIKAEVPAGRIRGPDPEFAMLFDNDPLEITLKRFEELGLSKLLNSSHFASIGRDEISQQTARTLNAEKCDAQGFDPAENEAWFLAAFASLWLDTGLADPNMAEAFRTNDSGLPLDPSRVLEMRQCQALIEFGRLLEWWRFRSEKHDRRAAGKGRSEGALPKAREARASNQKFDADWQNEARQQALNMRSKNPKRSWWSIAQELAKIHEKSARHVSGVIKSAIL